MKVLVAVFASAAISSSSARAGIEHWVCENSIGAKVYTQEWIIANDRMYALKQKPKLDMPVILNNESVAVAYYTWDKGGYRTYILDKREKVLIVLDDLMEIAMRGMAGRQDPDIERSPCRAAD